MRIYVACLASYNAGKLHGDWIDLDGKDVDEVKEEIEAILKASPEPFAEEYAVHDYEGFGFGEFNFGEYPNLQNLVDLQALASEFGEEVVEAAVGVTSSNKAAELREAIERGYLTGDSEADIAEDWFAESGGVNLDELPNVIRYCIDWRKVAEELRMGGDLTFERVNGTVYAFFA